MVDSSITTPKRPQGLTFLKWTENYPDLWLYWMSPCDKLLWSQSFPFIYIYSFISPYTSWLCPFYRLRVWVSAELKWQVTGDTAHRWRKQNANTHLLTPRWEFLPLCQAVENSQPYPMLLTFPWKKSQGSKRWSRPITVNILAFKWGGGIKGEKRFCRDFLQW